ncbi:conserved hypothetical protein [Ktedonobacter racemifer DSM 44963]|uniref:Uncharacterized protein n=1 Tax=Ktedonobacter racemifer DSM 44963 TaxID=485913 RepID=D6TCA6_KTERA|nr:conserved hypothetical protein [Ktedonobacter racemifer DSM 44963]
MLKKRIWNFIFVGIYFGEGFLLLFSAITGTPRTTFNPILGCIICFALGIGWFYATIYKKYQK